MRISIIFICGLLSVVKLYSQGQTSYIVELPVLPALEIKKPNEPILNAHTHQDVLIYPQPCSSFFRIKTNDYNQYILFDEKGMVYQRGWIDDTQTVERKNAIAGMYLLKLSNDEGQFEYRKIIFN